MTLSYHGNSRHVDPRMIRNTTTKTLKTTAKPAGDAARLPRATLRKTI